ncbi:MAG TPA: poly-gamma-glutamate biosynthesis protein PgsC [Candidatus Omnitrophota bacterium]|jgi:poly-gamma-glutamate biosynthesis protein PgsC/CapC|nr:poly-gamma-glutamate biosynthesis protein PgsC [Candidatus Eisenbacteria bacterium]HTM00834.1 poly-gamma-glutamate biosynthesis protein PgsC [Candidatus Omnitrophota bacterium]
MIEQAIGLGLAISLLFSETLGLAAGGMVVPGYVALLVHEPLRLVGTILVSLVTLGTLKLIAQYTLIYGRRRIVAAVLLGFIFGAISRDLLVFNVGGTHVELQTIGFVIPGLIANWMDRQGIVQTLCVMVTTAVLVRLLLMLLNGGALIR